MAYNPNNPNGQTTMSASAPVVIASDQSAVPISAASLPLPTGAATLAKQPALGTAGSASTDVLTVQGIASMTALKVDGSAVTQPISAASLPLPSGASTSAKQPALGTAGTASADVLTVQGIASMTALKVDPSGVTSPVSLASVPSHAVTNAGTFAVQATLQANSGVDIGKLTANQSVNVAQINGVTALMGNGTTGTGSQRVTIASDNTAFSVNAVESGTWTVQPGNTANSTPWLVTDTPSTSGGLSIITGSIGGTATAIKASAGQLYGYHLFNTTAAVAYVQIFNVASGSVTLGTTPPTFSVGIPASGGVTVNFDKGIAFGTAISFACTTTRTGSTGATCDVNFFYK